MQAIANRFGAACSMATRNGLRMILVQRCQGQLELVLNLHVGSQLPIAASTIGTAYIDCLSGASAPRFFRAGIGPIYSLSCGAPPSSSRWTRCAGRSALPWSC